MNHTLESSKLFPYVAFTIIIFFAIFVGAFSLSMIDTLATLEASTQVTEQAVVEADQ